MEAILLLKMAAKLIRDIGRSQPRMFAELCARGYSQIF